MRSFGAFALLAVSLLLVVSFAGSCDSSGTDGLMLYEIKPLGETEGISLHNYSDNPIDLSGYLVSDNPTLSKEGTITFTERLLLDPGETIVLGASESDDPFFREGITVFNGQKGVKFSSQFALNNKGDDVYLFRDDAVVDAFCYGNVTIDDPALWVGEPFKFMDGTAAKRVGVSTGSASDWAPFVPSSVTLEFDPEHPIDAKVTPFLFPDSGGIPIYRAIEAAEETVMIEVYEIGSANLFALLVEMEQRGGSDHVDVTIIVERSPVEGMNATVKQRLKTLEEAGADVYLIGGTSYDRYENMHAKYMVIDDDTVVITSENLVTANLSGEERSDIYVDDETMGNRGWGAIIESEEYASLMKSVFYADMDGSHRDVYRFGEIYPNVRSVELHYRAPSSRTVWTSYDAEIVPIFSPDNSYSATSYYISGAEDRVYVQMQSLGSYYYDFNESSPTTMMKAAADKGLDVRFILCDRYDDNSKISAEIANINMRSSIRAATMDIPYVHNKGIICDDATIVGSVNWTSTSFFKNREAAVAILSKQVAEYFARAYEEDFEMNYLYEGVTAEMVQSGDSYIKGEAVFMVHVKQQGDFTYIWDFGEGTKKTTTIPRTVVRPAEGTHTLTLRIVDNATGTDTVIQEPYTFSKGTIRVGEVTEPADSGSILQNPLLPIVLIVLIIGLFMISRKRMR